MRLIKYMLTLVFIFSVIKSYTQDIPEKYLLEAANKNPGLKAKFNEYMAALEKVPQVGALPDPQIIFGYFIQPVETRVGPQKARISVSQMFPWFGTLSAKEDVAIEMAKSKYEVFEEAKSRLYYDVKSTWYNVYFTQKAMSITLENINILTTYRKLALIKVESGKASSVDVLRVEIEIADLENQLALLKDNLLVMQTAFNNMLNAESGRIVDLPERLSNNDLVYTPQALLDSLQNSNHQILQMEYMQASYEKQEIVIKKLGKPNIMLGIDYMAIGKSANPMTSGSESGKDAIVFPMVGISVPLYRQKYTSMVKEAVFMQESAEFGKLDKINILETTLENALRDYNDANRRIPLFENQEGRAHKAMNILQTEYETNGKNFEEVLRMERQVLKYNLELEKALSDKSASIAFIDYLIGK